MFKFTNEYLLFIRNHDYRCPCNLSTCTDKCDLLWSSNNRSRFHEFITSKINFDEVKELIDSAKELRDLMEAVREGEYKPDSFTCQSINNALRIFEEKNEINYKVFNLERS